MICLRRTNRDCASRYERAHKQRHEVPRLWCQTKKIQTTPFSMASMKCQHAHGSSNHRVTIPSQTAKEHTIYIISFAAIVIVLGLVCCWLQLQIWFYVEAQETLVDEFDIIRVGFLNLRLDYDDLVFAYDTLQAEFVNLKPKNYKFQKEYNKPIKGSLMDDVFNIW